METLPNQKIDARLRRIEADMFTRMAVIFRRCPHLVGFTLADSAELPDDADTAGEDPGLFVSDIQFARRVTEDEDDEVCHYINKTVAEMITERAEALELLRDRTFARQLH
jgi:hypothetical protein